MFEWPLRVCLHGVVGRLWRGLWGAWSAECPTIADRDLLPVRAYSFMWLGGGTAGNASQRREGWLDCLLFLSGGLGVTSCPPSRTLYTRDLTIFYISTLSMLFDVCDQSCWQSCMTPVETRVDVLALCIPVF